MKTKLSMRPRLFLLLILLLLLVAGCGSGEEAYSSTPGLLLVTPAADSTATRTPFLPEGVLLPAPGQTGLPIVTLYPSDTPTPDPNVTPARLFPTLQTTPAYTLTPAPAVPLSQPQGQVSILILGSDKRPDSASFRTDTMILLTLRADGTVSLVSFPRDLYVYIPGFKMARMNGAFLYGGFNTLADTFEYNFGVRPQHYVMTNFDGFKSLVDSLGGVDVTVAQTMHDARSGYPDGYTVEPGIVHMDGEMALWYLRARYASSDMDRLRRTQEVLYAIGQKLLSLDALHRVPELYAAYQQTITTDLSLNDLLALLPALQAVNQDTITRYSVGYDQVTAWTEPGTGSYFLLPQTPLIQQLLRQALGIP